MRLESLAAAPDRAGRYRAVFSDGSVLRLYRQTIEDFALCAGKELSPLERQQLEQAAGEMSAKMRAVRIVSASSVSCGDLEQRLIHKGEAPEQAKAAVEWMQSLSLVDDEKTADQIVSRCIAKGYGVARAKQALYEKRIPKALWEAALAAYPDQQDRILDFLRARLGQDPEEKDVKRAVDALLRRGHSYGSIRQALSRLSVESEEYPED